MDTKETEHSSPLKRFKIKLSAIIAKSLVQIPSLFKKLMSLTLFQQLKNRIQTRFNKEITAGDSQTTFKEKTLNFIHHFQEIQEGVQKRLKNTHLHFYGKALTLILCTSFIADLLAIVIEKIIPEPPAVRSIRSQNQSAQNLKKNLGDYEIIFSRNLFNSKGIIPGEETGNPSDQGGVPVKSSLPLQLVGTLVMKNEIRSIATIEDKSASQVFPVRITDEIPGKAKILSIEAYKVIFVNTATGRREYIDLPQDLINTNTRIALGGPRSAVQSPGVDRKSPTEFNVAKTEVDKALQDLNQVLTQARAIPNFENGQPAGYKLYQIVPGSIYDKLGLQNGDTLCGLNGQPINDPGKAFELLSELKTAKSLELCVKRNGKSNNFSYNIQ